MADRQHRALATLEMELDTDAPTGVLSAADGSEHQFSGGMEFVSAIQAWQAQVARAERSATKLDKERS